MVQTSDFKPSKLKLHSNIEHFTEFFFFTIIRLEGSNPNAHTPVWLLFYRHQRCLNDCLSVFFTISVLSKSNGQERKQ